MMKQLLKHLLSQRELPGHKPPLLPLPPPELPFRLCLSPTLRDARPQQSEGLTQNSENAAPMLMVA
jgi:hypothetical protein